MSEVPRYLCMYPPAFCCVAVRVSWAAAAQQSEQVEAVLQEINVKDKPSSAGRLYEWIARHPGPEPAATAALAVKVVRVEMGKS